MNRRTLKIILFSLMLGLIKLNVEASTKTEVVVENDVNAMKLPHINVKKLEKHKKLVALTIDDGPWKYTEELLDILEKHDIKATFFLIGCNIELYPDKTVSINNDNHQIALHGYTHKSFTKLSLNEVVNELEETNNLLDELDIDKTNIVRPPTGSINDAVKSLDYVYVLWDVDTMDWKTKDKDKIITEIEQNIEENSIILVHEIDTSTLAALDEILPKLKKEYEFVTVNELFKENNQVLENSNSYYKVKTLKK